MLEHVALPALMQPGNLPAIVADGTPYKHVVWTVEAEHERVAEVFAAAMPDYEVEIRDRNPADFQIEDLKHMMVECHESGSRLLLAPPDLFWGNGSIANMVRYAEGRGITVAAANLRVDGAKFMEGLVGTMWPLSNAEVVYLTMQSLHPATLQMFDNEDTNATFFGGLSIRKLAENQWAMVHHLPSPWLVSVWQEDVDYWLGPDVINFGDWDHRWPSLLMEKERLRIVGSSDIAWSAEMTGLGGHYAPIHDGLLGNDRYKAKEPHNLTGGRMVMSLRGEPC